MDVVDFNENDGLIQGDIAAPPKTSRDNTPETSEIQTIGADRYKAKPSISNSDLVVIMTDNRGDEGQKA